MDNLFILAVLAFGWGLSLCTYRLFARSNGWPMGALQSDLPVIPVLLGIAVLVIGLLFATARGVEEGGWLIVIFGLLLAVFWTGLLRVGSQIALFLAPVATGLLLLGWLGTQFGFADRKWAYERPYESLQRKGYVKDKTNEIQIVPAPGQSQ